MNRMFVMRKWLRPLVVFVFAVVIGWIVAAPAMARHDRDDEYWRHHHRARHYHDRYYPNGYTVHRYYEEPDVYYAPPPVVYAPPEPSVGLSLVFPFHIHHH